MQGGREVRVFAGLPDLSRAAAGELASRAREVIRIRGRFTLVLAGGTTPRTLYELLASDPAFRDSLPWDKVHFFFSDERHVPPDHPDSNYRMAYRTLLSKIPAPPWNAHRMATELADAATVAEYCEEILRQFFRLGPGEVPRFDMVLLGMGRDGHTASLFPGSDALQETSRLAAAPWIEALEARRVTLTLPVLNHAGEVLFLISGIDKAEALKEVLEGEYRPERYPAQAIRPEEGRLLYFVDKDAARLLGSTFSAGPHPDL